MDLQKKLMKIGFTEYEAKVYLAMLSQYPARIVQKLHLNGWPKVKGLERTASNQSIT